jgi:hypothetical protein
MADTINPNLGTGEIEVFAQEIEVLSKRPRNCRCRSSASPIIRKTCASSTASSICAAKRCTGTSSPAPRSSPTCAKPHDRYRFRRICDPDPDRLVAGRRARLPGAEPHPPRPVLRAAAGAAAVQAASDGFRLRPLFPDRAVLPRRRPARRPAAGRILPARSRDELRHPGGRLGHDGTGDPRRVRGICRGQAGHPGVPPHSL